VRKRQTTPSEQLGFIKMASYRLNNLSISIEKEGARCCSKARSQEPIGKYSEIRTSDYTFQFNLRGQIKFIRGLNVSWPHPYEYLKRTDGNDWVFYSVGSVNGNQRIIDWLGEYYLPCLPYPSNSIWEFNPYTDPNIMQALGAWFELYATLHELKRDNLPTQVKDFLNIIADNNETALHTQAETVRDIIGGRVSVLPPDTRHVDYEVIPITIADGCLYQCKFCCVKSHQRFHPRSRDNIRRQIQRLKAMYGHDLDNFNALFLGNHDALGAGNKLLTSAAEAMETFWDGKPPLKDPRLFLFGSVDSMLNARNDLFEKLNKLPFYSYINIGFESIDASTLADINKPLDTTRMRDAFRKMLELNRDYANIEISANFLLGEQLSPAHNQSLAELLGSIPESLAKKGVIYLSPLMDSQNRPPLIMDNQKRRDLLQSFTEIKNQNQLPTYIYLIQRL
jgi:Radical SAM superfamily